MDMIAGDGAAEASSPETNPDRLGELADNYPELHARIVVNPACPEGLRQWILSLGSSEVRRAWEQHEAAQRAPQQQPVGGGPAAMPAPGAVRPQPVPAAAPAATPPQGGGQPDRKGGGGLRALGLVLLILVVLYVLYSCATGLTTFLSNSGGRSGTGEDTEGTGATSLTSPAPDDAVEAFWIQSPSQNISCELHDDVVGCSVAERYYAEAGLDDCYENLFSIRAGEDVSLSCGHDFIGSADGTLITLEYGSSAANDTYACTSRETGMTCWNQVTGSGFTVSREEYTVF